MVKSKFNTVLKNPFMRILIGIIGFAILLFLFVFSFRWEDFGIEFSGFGVNITAYVYASIMILAGILGGSMLKSAVERKGKIDI